MKEKDGRILLSALEMDVLTLLSGGEDLYGLELMQRLNQGRREYELPEVGFGSFYPTLKRLEKNGLVKSHWGDDDDKTSGGARRKYYKILGLGSSTLVSNQQYHAWIAGPALRGVTV